jgi:hypothetical protein
MVFRKPAAAAAAAAAQLQQMAARVRAGFPFTRSFELRRSFPQTDKTLFLPGVFEEEAKLTHPLAGDLSNHGLMLSFNIDGTAGAGNVFGSPITAGHVFVAPVIQCVHNDAAARHHLTILLQDPGGVAHGITDSRTDPGSAFITSAGVLDSAAGGSWRARHVIVPPGWMLVGFAFGGVPGATVLSLKGYGVVLPLSEICPRMAMGV